MDSIKFDELNYLILNIDSDGYFYNFLKLVMFE